MTLLRDIQDAAIGTDVPLSTVLRKAQVLAARLGHEPLRIWVSAELDGYRDRESLPDYRRLGEVPVLGHFSGMMGSGMSNAPIPSVNIPEELRDLLYTQDIYESVAELEALSKAGGSARYQWQPDIVAALATEIYENMALVQAFRVIPSSKLAGILDTVRNRLLAFAIDIEKLDPAAGDVGPGEPSAVAADAVSQVFNTNITGGNVTIAAAGRGNVTQTVRATVEDARTWLGVSQKLADWGVPAEEISALESAIAQDRDAAGTDVEVVVGEKARSWMGRLAGLIGVGSVKLTRDVGVETIATLLAGAAVG